MLFSYLNIHLDLHSGTKNQKIGSTRYNSIELPNENELFKPMDISEMIEIHSCFTAD